MWLRLLLLALVVVYVVFRLRRMRRLPAGAAARRPAAAPWNPHAVLGLETGATPDEVARAYREQMKRYHPDRVADMPREFQELAHQKTIEIQRAFAELGRR